MWKLRKLDIFWSNEFVEHFAEVGRRKIESSPNIKDLMNHSKEGRANFNKMIGFIISTESVNLVQEVSITSFNVRNVGPVLNNLHNWHQQCLFNGISDFPVAQLNEFPEELKRTQHSVRNVWFKQFQTLVDDWKCMLGSWRLFQQINQLLAFLNCLKSCYLHELLQVKVYRLLL